MTLRRALFFAVLLTGLTGCSTDMNPGVRAQKAQEKIQETEDMADRLNAETRARMELADSIMDEAGG